MVDGKKKIKQNELVVVLVENINVSLERFGGKHKHSNQNRLKLLRGFC